MGERADEAMTRGHPKASTSEAVARDDPRVDARKVAYFPVKTLAPDPLACTATGVGDSGNASRQLAESLDRSLQYFISRFTLGISPIGLSEAYFDWLIHLLGSPGKQVQLWNEAVSNSVKLMHYLSECACHEGARHRTVHRAAAS